MARDVARHYAIIMCILVIAILLICMHAILMCLDPCANFGYAIARDKHNMLALLWA
jgi:hypothetical protein